MMISYTCGVCTTASPEFDFQFEIDQEVLPEDFGWQMNVINFPNIEVHIPTCERCSKLKVTDIFDGYKKNVRSGKMVDFH